MYDVNSKHADDFINHEEILETLAYADENKNNMKLIDAIIEKAKKRKGLTHREASVLLACSDEDKNKEIYKLAELLCQRLYLLPVPREKQTYYEETALSGRDPKRSHRTSGHGA